MRKETDRSVIDSTAQVEVLYEQLQYDAVANFLRWAVAGDLILSQPPTDRRADRHLLT